MNLRPPQPIQRCPKHPQHQRAASSDQGDVPERSRLRLSSPIGLPSPRNQPSMTTRRPRRLFKPTLLPPKSKKASSPSASRAAIATKPTSNSLHRSRVWSVGEAPPTPTICGSLNRARWAARSATNSPYHCAERITGTTIAPETKSAGGRDGLLIPSRRRGCFGFPRGKSNEGHQKNLPNEAVDADKTKDGPTYRSARYSDNHS